MAQAFILTLKQMVVFLLVGQTLLHFGMGKQYEKYIRLIISLMITANMITAFWGLFRQLPYDGSSRSFFERWEAEMAQIEEELEASQKKLEMEWEEMNSQLSKQQTETEYGSIIIEEIVIQ